MDEFVYRDGQLFCEQINLDELVYDAGTPLYVYSHRTLETHYDALARAFAPVDPLICFAVRSCGNIHILKVLADRGGGAAVVSAGELYRAVQAGVPPTRLVMTGVGRADDDIVAGVDAGVPLYTVASQVECGMVATRAKQVGKPIDVALRIAADDRDELSPGLSRSAAEHLFKRFHDDRYCRLVGLHIAPDPARRNTKRLADAVTQVVELADALKADGHTISAINIGNIAAAYDHDEPGVRIEKVAGALLPLLQPYHDAGGRVILEPDRMIAANAGVLLTRIEHVTLAGRRKFVAVDGDVNHLVEPSHRNTWHFIWPTNVAPMHVPAKRSRRMPNPGLEACDVVGTGFADRRPIAKGRPLPPVARGDLLAVFGAGAYGMSLTGNPYGSPRPAEVLVHHHEVQMIRRRETFSDLVAPEVSI